MHVHIHMNARVGQKRVLVLLELGLEAAVSCLAWVFRTELRSSFTRAECSLTSWARSPGPHKVLKMERLGF